LGEIRNAMKKVNTGTKLQKKYKKHALKNSFIKGAIKRLIHFGQIDHKEDYATVFGSLAEPVFNAWDTGEANFIYDKYKDRTLLSKASFYTLIELAKTCKSKNGIFIELGTYKGGSARALADITNRQISCFDTFKGVAGATSKDVMEDGEFGDVDLKDIEYYLMDCMIFVGEVPGTFDKIKHMNIAFMHIDLDLYAPIYTSLLTLYDNVVEGGIILFDDYGTLSTPGAKSACDKFFKHKPENIIVLQTGQAFIIKQ